MSDVLIFLMIVGVSIVGSLPAGVINTTVMTRAVKENMWNATIMALGASIVEGVQIYVALVATDIILASADLQLYLRWFMVLVFVGFALYYFMTRNKTLENTDVKKMGFPLIEGMLVSTLNVMVFPFWAFWAVWLQNKDMIASPLASWPELVIGGAVGGFIAFTLYAAGGKWLSEKLDWFNRRINLIVCLIFLVMAVITVYWR